MDGENSAKMKVKSCTDMKTDELINTMNDLLLCLLVDVFISRPGSVLGRFPNEILLPSNG